VVGSALTKKAQKGRQVHTAGVGGVRPSQNQVSTMIYPVDFISLEDDEKDIIVSFAIPDDETGIKSLILHRTLFCEELLPDEERGVRVSLEGEPDAGETLNMLESIEISDQHIKINAKCRSYVVDVSKIDGENISELKALVEKQNYDHRFRIKKA
jgi:hypothetical protein